MLVADGWQVRGTSRSPAGVAAIEAAGLEGAQADPQRVGTILEQVGDVAVVVWALASAAGSAQALAAVHGPRLEHLLQRLVDTPVRGFVYEASGTAPAEALSAGAALVREAGARWRIPVAVINAEPGDAAWTVAAAEATRRVLDR